MIALNVQVEQEEPVDVEVLGLPIRIFISIKVIYRKIIYRSWNMATSDLKKYFVFSTFYCR